MRDGRRVSVGESIGYWALRLRLVVSARDSFSVSRLRRALIGVALKWASAGEPAAAILSSSKVRHGVRQDNWSEG